MSVWALLALGGAAGALGRYVAVRLVIARMGTSFPWGTLIVNTTGSFLLGLVLSGLAGLPLEAQLGALLAVGFLGDFTTFSTYAHETLALARQRRWTRAALYQCGSVALALAAVAAGMVLGELLRQG